MLDLTPVDRWLRSHVALVVAFSIALGFLLRLVDASYGYLNPDEALHFQIANQGNLRQVYRAGQTNAHPPLLYILLHLWSFLGTSELVLRSLSVVAGTLFLYLSFRWLERALGQTVGVVGVLLLALSPPLISLAAQVRHYSLLLLFMAGTLCFLERGFEEKSRRWIGLSSLFLGLALLTHYSALVFALAVGVYALIRVVRRELPLRVAALWAVLKLGALLLVAFLYVTHISELRTSPLRDRAMGQWLEASYFDPETDNLVLFPVLRSAAVFRYVFTAPAAAVAALALFVLGTLLLLAPRARGTHVSTRHPAFGVLLLLPWVLSCALAMLRLYPYGGSRHNVFLAVFAIAGVSFVLVELFSKRLAVLVLTVFVLALGLKIRARLPPRDEAELDQARRHMSSAVEYIHQAVPAGAFVLVDRQTRVLLAYYLARDQITPVRRPAAGFEEHDYGGRRVISGPRWSTNVTGLANQLQELEESYGSLPTDSLWIIDAGWGTNLSSHFSERFPDGPETELRTFGRHVSVFRLPRGFASPERVPRPPDH